MALENALLEVQKKLEVLHKDKKNPFFNSNYADINDVLSVVKPVLNDHGLTVWQPMEVTEHGTVLQTKILNDKGDVVLESAMLLPQISDPQKMGSAITYFRRYSLQSLLSLEAEDDDGNTASAPVTPHKPTQGQFERIESTSSDELYTCATCGGVAKHKSGISKAGKPYNGLFCSEDKKHVQWLKEGKKPISPELNF